jgi:hypothetical protein
MPLSGVAAECASFPKASNHMQKSGFVFGASATNFHGTVSNIRSPYDVAGVYGAAGAVAALGVGGQAIVLTNEKGAVLSLTGQQIGLQINADLSGLAISMR